VASGSETIRGRRRSAVRVDAEFMHKSQAPWMAGDNRSRKAEGVEGDQMGQLD